MSAMGKYTRYTLLIVSVVFTIAVSIGSVVLLSTTEKSHIPSLPSQENQNSTIPTGFDINGRPVDFVDHQVKNTDLMSNDQVFWFPLSAHPMSRSQGTTVFFGKGMGVKKGDMFTVHFPSGMQEYLVDEVFPHVSPQDPQWSVVGKDTFNRTAGPEKLVFMLVEDKSFTVYTATPIQFRE